MPTISIDAYSLYSESARLLADELDCYIIKHRNSRYRDSPRKVVINWGNTRRNWINTINRCENVQKASSKLHFFRAISGEVRTPPWSTDIEVAKRWSADGRTVVCRTLVSASEGRGIILVPPGGDITPAPLYTAYVPKRSEFRVHVVNGKSISVQRKVRRAGLDQAPNFQVRNTANGFVFQRNNIQVPQDVIDQAIKAVTSCGLDFGGVDVIWNERQQQAYVLEVNTAPGIEGTTVKEYAQALKELVDARST